MIYGRSLSKGKLGHFICRHLDYLLLEVSGEFIPGELVVFVEIDLLEDVDGLRALLRVDQFDVEVESGSTRNDISGTLIAVTES